MCLCGDGEGALSGRAGGRMQRRAEVRRWRGARGGGAGRRGQGRGHGSAVETGGRLRGSLVVEEEGALMDERLDDGLVGACGREGVHGGEVGSHERGPEADGQVLAGHQIHPVPLADPVIKQLITSKQIHYKKYI